MAIDFSFGGIGVHADPTNVGISIGDLAGPGSGLDFDVHHSPDGETTVSINGFSISAGPEMDLESLLGQQNQNTAAVPEASTADAATHTEAPNSFDPATLSSLTLLGGVDDTGLDNIIHHPTGA